MKILALKSKRESFPDLKFAHVLANVFDVYENNCTYAIRKVMYFLSEKIQNM